jgi:hypothetical protein
VVGQRRAPRPAPAEARHPAQLRVPVEVARGHLGGAGRGSHLNKKMDAREPWICNMFRGYAKLALGIVSLRSVAPARRSWNPVGPTPAVTAAGVAPPEGAHSSASESETSRGAAAPAGRALAVVDDEHREAARVMRLGPDLIRRQAVVLAAPRARPPR